MLDSAIKEFEDLVEKTAGQERLDNILSLCAALLDKSEASPKGDAETEKALRRVEALAMHWLPSYEAEPKPVGYFVLSLFLAQVLQKFGKGANYGENWRKANNLTRRLLQV